MNWMLFFITAAYELLFCVLEIIIISHPIYFNKGLLMICFSILFHCTALYNK